MKQFILDLLKNNTGVSLKAFVALLGIVNATLMVLSVIVVLIVDLLDNFKIDSDLYGVATLIGAIAGFIVAAVWGKVKGESNQLNKDTNE